MGDKLNRCFQRGVNLLNWFELTACYERIEIDFNVEVRGESCVLGRVCAGSWFLSG